MGKEKTQTALIIVEICLFAGLVGMYRFLWPVLFFVILGHVPAKVLKK